MAVQPITQLAEVLGFHGYGCSLRRPLGRTQLRLLLWLLLLKHPAAGCCRGCGCRVWAAQLHC
jgi:hypothetical protein